MKTEKEIKEKIKLLNFEANDCRKLAKEIMCDNRRTLEYIPYMLVKEKIDILKWVLE